MISPSKPDQDAAAARADERARIVARIRREADETFDVQLHHEFRALAHIIEQMPSASDEEAR